MVRLVPVNEENFSAIIKMKVSEEQKKYVADNMYSLAQAWLYYEETKPYAVLDDDTPVGFMMFDWQEGVRTVAVWRFMIDVEQQHKGYGRKALEAAIEMLRKLNLFDILQIDHVKDNEVAKKLYLSLGFEETGEIVFDTDVVMKMKLTDQPKLGQSVMDDEDLEEFLEFLLEDAKEDSTYNALFPAKEELEQAVEEESVIRYTIYGETIGIRYAEKVMLRKKFLPYKKEI